MFLTANSFSSDTVRHGFFTREGGVSGGIYASLNVGIGSSDERKNVLENRRLVTEALGAQILCCCYQVHGSNVQVVSEPWRHDAQPPGDAMVTNRPGIALGILTADCVPVLFADREAGVIGAAHSGWKGAFGGVLEATIAEMEILGARRERIVTAIGPAIAQSSYEVGPEFRDTLRGAHARNDAHFATASREGYYLFDLPGYVRARLATAGVKAVEVVARDTCAEEETFFSYRRACLRGEDDYGRQVSAIMLI